MLTLRRLTEADADDLRAHSYAGLSLKEIQTLIGEWNRLEFQGKYFEMLAMVEDGAIVGTISVYQRSSSVVEIGPEVFMAHRQRGYAKKAMLLAMEMAESKGYKIAVQQVRADNAASIALHRSLGFETDGYPYVNRKGHEVNLFLKSLL